MYSLFAAPPDRDLDWQEDGRIRYQSSFLGRRAYRFVTRHAEARSTGDNPASRTRLTRQSFTGKLHQTIDKITHDFDSRWHFNTSIASLMELVNELLYQLEAKTLDAGVLAEVCRDRWPYLLAPFAPLHSARPLWRHSGPQPGPVFREKLAHVFNPDLAVED